MAENVLIVTPNSNFGEIFRSSLENAEVYRVYIANNKAAAVVRADEESCKLAFLDMELGEQWVEEIGQSLRTVIPGIQLFILADDENPPALDTIRPWTLVRKSADMSDLFNNTNKPPTVQSSPNTQEQELPWLSDVSKAAQHLTRLTLESSSQAALITRKNDLWAYAGQLSQAAANEIAQTLAKSWSTQKGSDLLRFVRLESTKAEHMLYATELAENVLLAMVFDAETPFSTIRSQASQLVTSLSENETKEEKSVWQKTTSKSEPISTPTRTNEVNEENIVIPSISEILTDIPSPNPQPVVKPRSPEVKPASLPKFRPAPADPGETRRSIFSRESSVPVPLKDLLLADQPVDIINKDSSHSMEELEVTAPSKSQPRPQTPIRIPAPGELDETRPHSINEVAGRIVLEPASAGVYQLTYACLLVPRFTSHYLTGDIADKLSEWIPNICIAFGWRLEHLAVRPEYLQWVVNVPPATSPGYLMRIIRQQTSEKVFAEFSRLRKENPSGDFWAPGYLIMGGTQPHPPQLVKDYIKQIRQRQGIEKPHH